MVSGVGKEGGEKDHHICKCEHHNPFLTISNFVNNPGKEWNWSELSYNYFEMDIEVVEMYLNKYSDKDHDFKRYLKSCKNHLKYRPEGQGLNQVITSWKTKIDSETTK